MTREKPGETTGVGKCQDVGKRGRTDGKDAIDWQGGKAHLPHMTERTDHGVSSTPVSPFTHSLLPFATG